MMSTSELANVLCFVCGTGYFGLAVVDRSWYASLMCVMLLGAGIYGRMNGVGQ